MSKKITFTLALLIIVLGSCKRDKTWKVRDFIYEKKLTGDVSGIASIPGSVFVSGYEKKDAIGIVDSLGHLEQYMVLPSKGECNAIRVDRGWNMYMADSVNHCILLVKSGEKVFNVFARDSNARSLKLLAMTSNGVLFTNVVDAGGNSLCKISANGEIIKVDSGFGVVHGIEVSPADKFLYVNEADKRKIWRYNLDSLGNVSGKKEFFTFQDNGLAGMRCDSAGNLFVCRTVHGVVAVLSPDGKLLREVELQGKNPSDISFGGFDGKSVWVTMRDRGIIETFKSEFPGREWVLFQK